jgi:membrane associated rhomboid family serine protease
MSILSSTPPPPGAGFRLDLTPFGRSLLGLYLGLWAAVGVVLRVLPASLGLPARLSVPQGPAGFEVATSFDLGTAMALQAPGAAVAAGPGFQWWQLITASFFTPPGGFSTLVVAILGFLFFAAPVERFLGRRGFLALWATGLAGGVIGACLAGPIVHPTQLHHGIAPAVLAVMIVHCLITPNAIVPFLFVLQVRMRWVAIGISALVLVRALSLTAPLGNGPVVGGYELGGVVAGWLWWRYGRDLDLRRLRRRRRAKAILRVAVDDALRPGADDGPVFH